MVIVQPTMNRIFIIALSIVLIANARAPAEETKNDFQSFVANLWPDAKASGVSRATFDAAFKGLTPDPQVIAATKRQPEYIRPAGAYIASLVSEGRVAAGRKHMVPYAETLAAVEAKFGVDRFILLSIWGIESNYGREPEGKDVIRSLATLAEARYRDDFFRHELISALVILQQGRVAREKLIGSWAGAMGQPQFIPSSFLRYAIDFSGGGRADIWTNVLDVLASIANYFRESGWTAGMPWGFEVTIPAGFDYRKSRAPFMDWTSLGVKRADGGALPGTGDAILLFPSGYKGPAFLVTKNFEAIKRYNNSDAYALAAVHLADRLRGAGPIRAPWPDDDKPLSREERVELQRALATLGYKVNNFQGQIDFDLRDNIREIQTSAGRVADGNPDAALLAIIRDRIEKNR
ncbi:MAG TPA: lytic murein transglycosylase [Xanthobacteraceae bacterium]|nr:lytic murein transglycosylase [Xanthobacteraceae bacterium]